MTVQQMAEYITEAVKAEREIPIAELVDACGPEARGPSDMADQTGAVFAKDASAVFVQAFNLACMSGDSHIRIWRCADGQHFTATYVP